MNVQTSARSRAIATQDAAIAANVAKIEEAKARPTAIQAMASRLNLSTAKLQDTLRLTVFKDANDAEFAALIVVANEFKLNPLTKEIYAFRQKGGGIVPLVSIDGWVRIMNEHPQYDGIEFNDILDDAGQLYAIESVIYRKDRTRPIKVTEYMDECRRETDPWKKSPNRMLRHRSLIQGARYAFGFSGIYADDEVEIQMIGEPVEARNVTPPTRGQIAQEADEPYDPDTGLIYEQDAPPPAEEGPAESDRGDQHDGTVTALLEALDVIETVPNINSWWSDRKDEIAALPDADRARVEDYRDKRVAAIKAGR